MASIKAEKLWADAVRQAVHEYHETKDENGKVQKVRWLRLLAETVVKKAASGDIQAIKEVGDRLDGKPAQAIDQTIRDERKPAELTNAEIVEQATGLIDQIEGSRSRSPRKRASQNGSSDLH